LKVSLLRLDDVLVGDRQLQSNFTMSFLQILQEMGICVDCPIEEKDQGRVWEQLYLILI
jgi:hypothetical protein